MNENTSASAIEAPAHKTRGINWKFIKRDRYLYLCLVPALLYYIIFKYTPMAWLTIAFKDYHISDGLFNSAWVGLKQFQMLFTSEDFWKVFRNTLMLNIYSLVVGFPIPIILAILINEIKNVMFKKVTQTILYLPHFISWVVIGGIIIMILSPSTGVVNIALHNLFGMEPYYFMAHNFSWTVSYLLSGIWKGAGWGSIIYLAAISNLDPALYEAAKIDGAGKFKQIWHVTLPGIRGTIAILLIMRMGHMLGIGFEQIYVMMNDAVLEVSDVISTYTYRLGVVDSQYSYTTALGIFESLISMILMFAANKIVKMLGENGIW